jgi:type IV pilus assembly protein PilB
MEKLHSLSVEPVTAHDIRRQDSPPRTNTAELPRPAQPIEHADDLALTLTSHRSLHGQPAAQRIAGQQRRPLESPEELARRLGLPFVKLKHFEVDPQALASIPEAIAREHLVLPLFLLDEHLVVALENPANSEINSLLQFVSGRSIDLCAATHDDLVSAIQHHYGAHENDSTLHELEITAQRETEAQITTQEAERLGQEKPIVRLVNNILSDAIARRVSDIHIRPNESQVELLFRQDGTLVKLRNFSKALLPAVVARIKILGRMNIAERRLPQDGRARMTEGSSVVDMRISVIPTVKGESVVIRLLNVDAGMRAISEIGFTAQDAELFTDLLHKSYGMLLVTGPTGCGKSTTLYAALQEIRSQNVNIITVEDPVEYRMEGVQQIQVNTAPGFNFARALRNILRHDPDVIMVGEIRDQETAKIAVESALTGHLVLSTLHTNDAPTAVTRLIEMGVESFLVKSSLLGVLAQRLVRLNCPHCIQKEPVDETVRKFLGVPITEYFYHGAGCDACNQTGFKGRMAVYELLIITPQLRDLLHRDTPVDAIRRQAIADGMRPLTEGALQVARERRISLAEVYRVRLQ